MRKYYITIDDLQIGRMLNSSYWFIEKCDLLRIHDNIWTLGWILSIIIFWTNPCLADHAIFKELYPFERARVFNWTKLCQEIVFSVSGQFERNFICFFLGTHFRKFDIGGKGKYVFVCLLGSVFGEIIWSSFAKLEEQ